jgi:hypothetical protein
MDTTQAKQLAELHDAFVPYAGWGFHGKLADGSQDPADAYAYLRGTNATVKSLALQVTAQGAAITALAQQLGDTNDGVDTAAVVAAVQQAIENAVVKVDVSVGDNTTTRG